MNSVQAKEPSKQKMLCCIPYQCPGPKRIWQRKTAAAQRTVMSCENAAIKPSLWIYRRSSESLPRVHYWSFPGERGWQASRGLEEFYLLFPGDNSVKDKRQRQCVTCGAPLEPWAVGGHQGRVPRLSGFPDSYFEGTSNHVAPVELDVDRVDTILVGDEANSILIWESEQRHRVKVGPWTRPRWVGTKDRSPTREGRFYITNKKWPYCKPGTQYVGDQNQMGLFVCT